MRQSLRLGTISGIPVGLNWGLLLVAGFYLFNLAIGILPSAVPGSSTFSYWTVAAVNVALFFGSVLAHELGHAIVAQRNDIKVLAITLWFLGGVAQLEKEAESPGAEFRIAIAGPAVSVAIGAFFGGLWLAVSVLFGSSLLSFSFGYLAAVNIVLAVFNMIPAAPLDGGRVLAAALWQGNRNRHQARAIAARAGQAFGNALLIVGILGVITGAGTFVVILLGFFLRSAAGAERFRADRLNLINSAGVTSSMLPIVAPIAPGITVAGLESMSQAHETPVAFPLWGARGIVGLVPSTAVAAVPPSMRTEVFVQDLVVAWNEFSSATIAEPMPVVAKRAQDASTRHVLIYNATGNQVGYLDLAGDLSLQPA